MTSTATITLSQAEYDALVERCSELEDRLAAMDADNSVRVPHQVALAIFEGRSPVRAYREYGGLTLRQLSSKAGISVSYLSEIENGRKTGSSSALFRLAKVLKTTVDALLMQ